VSVIDNRVDESNLDNGGVVLWRNTMGDVDCLCGQSDGKNDWYWFHALHRTTLGARISMPFLCLDPRRNHTQAVRYPVIC